MLAGVSGVIAVDSQLPEVIPQETLLGEGSASIIWPVVEGEFPGVARINEILDYRNVTGETIEETGENYSLYGAGIVGSSFLVQWMDTEYLDLTITVETVGAYPSSMVFHYLFDLDSGEEVVPEDIFLQERIPDLVKLCDRELQSRIDNGTEEEYIFTEGDLKQIGIRRGGIVFHYDFHFPHVIAASEPDGELFFYWDEMNEFLVTEVRH